MCSERRGARALSLLVVASALVSAAPAAAYIDPGTAGLVVGGAGSALLWVLGGLAFLRLRLLSLLGGLFGFFRRHPGGSGAALVLVVVAGILGARWLTRDEPAPAILADVEDGSAERVLLLGVDGVDPDVVQQLLDERRLPNLARIIESGGFSPFGVPNPAESPVVWASLATGKNPGQHGVFDFIGRDAERYLPSLALLEREGDEFRYPLRAETFWDVTNEHGVPSTLVRWPMTFPPRAHNGRVFPGLGVPDVRGSLGRYSYFTDRAPPDDAEGNDKVTVVTVKDGVVDSALTGPRARTLLGSEDLTLPLRVELGADGDSALVTLAGQTYALREGEWTPFVEVTFADGLFEKHRGIVKLHLESVRDPFALYATPVEIHPDAPIVPLTTPPEYASELRQAIGLYHTLGMPEDTKALGEGRLSQEAFFAMCDDIEEQRRKMLLHELARFEKGVLAMVFDTPDRIQHMTPFKDEVTTSAIGRYLVELDRFLGTVLEKMPPETALILFSDHGFSTFERAVDLNRWLIANGFMVIDEEAWRAREPGTFGELYRYVDWSRTKAYAVGFAGIFVNVAGREGQGVVPADEREDVVREIQKKLAALKDPETGAPVVHRVYAREEIYDGKYAAEAPDVVVGFQPGYRGSWQSAVGGVTKDVVWANDKPWQRDHIVDASFVEGTLVTSFPLAVEEPHVYDLAPTVLSLLGLPVPADMEGRPLHKNGKVALVSE